MPSCTQLTLPIGNTCLTVTLSAFQVTEVILRPNNITIAFLTAISRSDIPIGWRARATAFTYDVFTALTLAVDVTREQVSFGVDTRWPDCAIDEAVASCENKRFERMRKMFTGLKS